MERPEKKTQLTETIGMEKKALCNKNNPRNGRVRGGKVNRFHVVGSPEGEVSSPVHGVGPQHQTGGGPDFSDNGRSCCTAGGGGKKVWE